MISKSTIRFDGRKILLIAPKYFGYEKVLVDSIKARGGEVEFIDERPANDFLTKSIIRVNSRIMGLATRKYYRDKFDCFENVRPFDTILIISPEAISKEILLSLRRRFFKAEFILYMWDSITNKTGRDAGAMLDCFDRTLSFDRKDCENYPNMLFRPLFFRDEYSKIESLQRHYNYDIVFIGTIHSDRYNLCCEVLKIAEQLGLRTYFFLYLSDKKLFWFSRFTNPAMKKSKLSEFSFKPLSIMEVVEKISQSHAVLDIQHPRQIGLTMRSIEVIGARRKLITTNQNIASYDFYSPRNIRILNRENITIDLEYFNTPFLEIDPTIYDHYSMDGWLKDVFHPVSNKQLV